MGPVGAECEVEDDDGPMFNDDGSAVDPDEFRRWLMSNPEKMKEIEKENARLRRAISDLPLDNQILQEVIKGKF